MATSSKPGRAKQLKTALENWLDRYGREYGFRFKQQIGTFLDVYGWTSISDGNAITKKESYAALYYFTDLPEADPRTLPSFDIPIPSGKSITQERKMSEEEWQDWVQSSPIASKIREFKAAHQQEDALLTLNLDSQKAAIQTPQMHQTGAPAPETDLSFRQEPRQSSPGMILDTFLGAIGTTLGAAVAAGINSASIPAPSTQMDATVLQRLEKLEQQQAEIANMALMMTRMLTTSEKTAPFPKPSEEEADNVNLRTLSTRDLAFLLNNKIRAEQNVKDDVLAELAELLRKIYPEPTSSGTNPLTTKPQEMNLETLATTFIQHLDEARSGTDEDRAAFIQHNSSMLNKLARLLSSLGRRTRPIHTPPTSSVNGERPIKELVSDLEAQLRLFVEQGTADSRDELYNLCGPELTQLWALGRKLTLPHDKREEAVRAQQLSEE